jgi:DNA-binding YbaB/EbfC family protein
MFGNMDISKMTEMLGDMQKKAEQIQKQAKSVEMTAKGAGGKLSITINGAGEVVDVTIEPSLLNDRAALQLMLMSTFNDAQRMVDEHKRSQAMGMFSGLNPFGS